MSRVTITRASVTRVRYNSKYSAGSGIEAIPSISPRDYRSKTVLARLLGPHGTVAAQHMTPEGAKEFAQGIIEMVEGMGA